MVFYCFFAQQTPLNKEIFKSGDGIGLERASAIVMDGDLSFPSHVANRYEMKGQKRGKIEEKPDAQETSEGAKSFVPAAIMERSWQ